MKRYTLILLIGVLLVLMVALAGGAAAEPAAPAVVAAGDVFPIGPAEGEKYGPVADMDAAGNLIVAWSQGGDVFIQRLNADGSPNGAPMKANTTPVEEATIDDLSADGAGNFVVVWGTYPDYGMRGRCFDPAGDPNGPEFSLQGAATNLGGDVTVEMAPDGSFVAAWVRQEYTSDMDRQIIGRRFSAACAPLGDAFTINNLNPGYEGEPDIAMDAAGNFIVAWTGVDNHWNGVFARYFDSDGAPRGGQFRVNQRQPYDQGPPSVGMDADGNAVIAYGTNVNQSGIGFNHDVLIRRYDAVGRPMGNEFSPHGPSPDVQYLAQTVVAPTGEFAVMWTTTSYMYDRELWLQAYDASGAAIGPKRPVAVGQGDQYLGTLATGGGGKFLAAWPELIALDQTQLYGRLLDFYEEAVAQGFWPTNDTYVMEARPKNTYGSQAVLQVNDAAKDVNTYIKFNVSSLSGTVQSATLRLWVNDPGPDGGTVYAVSPFYEGTTTLGMETGLTWNNAPAIAGFPLDVVGPAMKGYWVELDVTAAVVAAQNDNGRVSLAIANDARNLVKYASDESAKRPELIVYTD